MTLSIDQLLTIFDEAYEERAHLEFPTREMKLAMSRAAMGAVVRALRDECGRRGHLNWDDFDEILGDAGEKVAGNQWTASTQPPMRNNATDAAPAVCEWTQQSLQAFYNSACGLDSMTHGNAVCKCQDTCPSCGKPIAFKEANHG